MHTAQEYWDDRSELFASYYTKPSLFDRIFRKAVYTRTAVALKVIQEYPGTTVLDVGSGPGLNSVTWLKNSQASSLVGIDFAESMVARARQEAAAHGLEGRARFIAGDFMAHDFGGEKFGVAVAAGVFDYVRDAGEFLKKMAAVAEKAVVGSWPENGLRMMLRRRRYTCPVYHYTEADLRRLHEEAGLPALELVTTPGGWVTIARRQPPRK